MTDDSHGYHGHRESNGYLGALIGAAVGGVVAYYTGYGLALLILSIFDLDEPVPDADVEQGQQMSDTAEATINGLSYSGLAVGVLGGGYAGANGKLPDLAPCVQLL